MKNFEKTADFQKKSKKQKTNNWNGNKKIPKILVKTDSKEFPKSGKISKNSKKLTISKKNRKNYKKEKIWEFREIFENIRDSKTISKKQKTNNFRRNKKIRNARNALFGRFRAVSEALKRLQGVRELVKHFARLWNILRHCETRSRCSKPFRTASGAFHELRAILGSFQLLWNISGSCETFPALVKHAQ